MNNKITVVISTKLEDGREKLELSSQEALGEWVETNEATASFANEAEAGQALLNRLEGSPGIAFAKRDQIALAKRLIDGSYESFRSNPKWGNAQIGEPERKALFQEFMSIL